MKRSYETLVLPQPPVPLWTRKFKHQVPPTRKCHLRPLWDRMGVLVSEQERWRRPLIRCAAIMDALCAQWRVLTVKLTGGPRRRRQETSRVPARRV